jgi:propanol-preferring alcohol dehydrogenase
LIFEANLQGITVTGSIVGTRIALVETFQMQAEGRKQVVRESRHLENVNQSFAPIEKGDVDGHLVFDFL